MTQQGKMSVLLVGNYAPDLQHSMLGFVGAMASGLPAHGVSVKAISPRPRLAPSIEKRPSLGKWLGYVDKYVLFPRALRRVSKGVDVVHICDQGNAIYTRHLRSKPHVVTCHDLLAVRSALGELPYWKTRKSGKVYQQSILAGLKDAHLVCCDSIDSRDNCLRLTGLGPDRVDMVYLALLEQRSRTNEPDRDKLLLAAGVDPSCKFILHVGANQPYKNRAGVVRIFSAYQKAAAGTQQKLVLAGKPPLATLTQVIDDEAVGDSIVWVINPSSETITALYSGASMLLFPSQAEGFGLPILEAQTCGCPVVTTNRAPMTEVGGDAAVYIDPDRPDEAAAIIRGSEPDRQKMIERGYANVQRFSVDNMLSGYVDVYAKALSTCAARRVN